MAHTKADARKEKYHLIGPQVQERLTEDIPSELMDVLSTKDVAVAMGAVHLCVTSRGIRDTASSTVTAGYRCEFLPRAKTRVFKFYALIC